MKVKQLIKQLSRCNQQAEVMLDGILHIKDNHIEEFHDGDITGIVQVFKGDKTLDKITISDNTDREYFEADFVYLTWEY